MINSYLNRINRLKYRLEETGDMEDYEDAQMLHDYIGRLEELLDTADDHDVFVGSGGWRNTINREE